ncbi:aminotransferase class V-fold PLP-dependent enzyme [Nocardioides sp. W7]|uniref:aminotransferase class V-fold PLP-dependent enzyme n=1 Tax=Nocardioides sp. W7 TaxID=2931390 RepID=UPI001FD1A2B5|nr:aminotransferase class V-fold PLP-dependent enzyme [Nocardioides sp. W7]
MGHHYGYVSERLISGGLLPQRRRERRPDATAAVPAIEGLDVEAMRSHFDFPATGRIVTNNAATTQTPRELVDLYRRLTPWYEGVHRGQSTASQRMTERFEESYDTIATWINAPSRRTIATYRNTTEAINAVMYSLLTEFRDGDNVVTTLVEHNSNFVPWYALAREVLPRFGRSVECRVARFDHDTGQLDVDHLAGLVDSRTKLVCVSGASNFLGSKPPLGRIRAIAHAGGYLQPTGERGSLLLVDAAQLAPTTLIDVQELGVDYLAFSFHKMLAPFGVGVLYARGPLLERSLPFLYGGDMVAEGKVGPDRVEYGELPWKFAAGTPNVLGVIASAQALRLLADLALAEDPPRFESRSPLCRADVVAAMNRVNSHVAGLTDRALARTGGIPGLHTYGPPAGVVRSPLLAFTVRGTDPRDLAAALDEQGVEARAGCHCASLAHRDLGLDVGTCRLSFAAYTNNHDVDRAVDALAAIVRRG